MAEKHILIVEDDNPLARALQLKLKHSDFEVDRATDGQAGQEFIEKGGYDLILLDLVMPRKNGFEILEWLKETGNTTPVMVLTNLSQKEDELRSRDLGAVDFFVKSNVPIATIVRRVEQFLEKK